MANASDTTTVLNPGVGGDSMDEALVTQADGATTGKRPRVDVGFQTDGEDQRHRVVSRMSPLPIEDGDSHEFLRQMAEDMRALRIMVQKLLTD